MIDKVEILGVLNLKIIDLLWWLRDGGCWPWCDDVEDGGEQYPPAGGWTDEYDGWC